MTSKYLIGSIVTMILIFSGLFWWQTVANPPLAIPESTIPPTEAVQLKSLPEADKTAPQFGPAPPTPPKASQLSREEKRFNRYDLDKNEILTRIEMMSSRTKAFKKTGC